MMFDRFEITGVDSKTARFGKPKAMGPIRKVQVQQAEEIKSLDFSFETSKGTNGPYKRGPETPIGA